MMRSPSRSLFAVAVVLGLVLSLVACSTSDTSVSGTSTPAHAGAAPGDSLLGDSLPSDSLLSEQTSTEENPDPAQSSPGQSSPETNELGSDPDETQETAPPALSGDYVVKVIATIPHDPEAFTQGLELVDGRLLESQGLQGASARTWIDAATGTIEQQVKVQDQELFAEGITVVGDRFIQLSWTSGIALTGAIETLTADGPPLFYEGEGWGLCFDGERLVRSDGTSRLTFHDPETFEEIGSITVHGNDGSEIDQLNELECVGSQILANVWGWDHLLAINAQTGALDALIDATSLRPSDTPFELNYALNGVAYDETTNRYYLTGKRWPVIYLVEFEPAG